MFKQSGVFTITAIFGVIFFAVILVVVFFLVDPLERFKQRQDQILEKQSTDLIVAIQAYLSSKGRLPWSDDFGSQISTYPLPWSKATAPEIGICANSACNTWGELVQSGALNTQLAEKFLKSKDYIFVAKGKSAQSLVYACFIPKSNAKRKPTGELYTLKPGAPMSYYEVPAGCPDSTGWKDEDDVCYECMAK